MAFRNTEASEGVRTSDFAQNVWSNVSREVNQMPLRKGTKVSDADIADALKQMFDGVQQQGSDATSVNSRRAAA